METSSYLVTTENKERFMQKPYVVSADIEMLIGKWGKAKGFNVPSNAFFNQLRSNFTDQMNQIFPSFELVTEEEISSGLKQLVDNTGLYPISLDRVYFNSTSSINITRLVDEQLNDRGLGKRFDSPSLLQQFKDLKNQGINEAILVDDVIYSGGLIKRISNMLSRTGIQVPKVCAGIVVNEGARVVEDLGKELLTVRYFDEVIDEVCERDFYPGVPLSGRTVDNSSDIGAPYILPFGQPSNWGSIPAEQQESFSRFCIGQTIKLFSEIERVSEKPVRCCDLDRKVINLPRDATRFVDILGQKLLL